MQCQTSPAQDSGSVCGSVSARSLRGMGGVLLGGEQPLSGTLTLTLTLDPNPTLTLTLTLTLSPDPDPDPDPNLNPNPHQASTR